MPDSPEKRRNMLLAVALVAVTALAYLPVVRDGGFIWDDESYVINNKTLRDVPGLKAIWADPAATPQYYPLVHTTFWMEHQLWKLDPRGYHITNVLLHALAAVILWRLFRYLGMPGAWLAAALFAVHPVHVESVAWVTERKNVLSGVFYLGAALAYLKAIAPKPAGQRRAAGYVWAFILFLCALLSKTVTATLPAALMLVIWWKGWVPRRQAWRHILLLTPFFVVGLIASSMTATLEIHHVGASGAEWDLSFVERCLIAGRAVWFYFGKLLWPSSLCFNYQRWNIDAGVWWQHLFPLAAGAAVILLWSLRKRIGRGPLVAVLFFGGSLLPALGFFDVYPMRYSFVADHFQYLASIGILALASAAAVRICKRHFLPLLATALIVLLAFLTANQCGIYRDLETLWLDTIDKNPTSWLSYNSLGQLYINQGRTTEALPLFRKAMRCNPQEGSIHFNLGVAMSRHGHIDEAMQHYQDALALNPGDAQIWNNMGAAMARSGQIEKAMSCYRKALETDPGLATAHSNLGSSLVTRGRIDEALPHHEKAAALMPDLGSVHLKYGEALQAAGQTREAQDQYRAAERLDPSLAEADYRLGLIALNDKLLPAALHHFRRAVEKAPTHAPACNHLAVLLAGKGKNSEAIDLLRHAVKLDPGNAEHHNNLGVILVRVGHRSEALIALEEAVRLNPDYADAKKNLADLQALLEDK